MARKEKKDGKAAKPQPQVKAKSIRRHRTKRSTQANAFARDLSKRRSEDLALAKTILRFDPKKVKLPSERPVEV